MYAYYILSEAGSTKRLRPASTPHQDGKTGGDCVYEKQTFDSLETAILYRVNGRGGRIALTGAVQRCSHEIDSVCEVIICPLDVSGNEPRVRKLEAKRAIVIINKLFLKIYTHIFPNL